MTLEIVRFASIEAQPWKNGGGQTRELFVRPRSGRHFTCRISIADIDRPSAFSRFDGIDRTLTVIEGNGVDLTIGSESSSLRLLQSVTFSGEDPVDATPVRGSTRDFNVMTRRDKLRHSLRVVAAGAHLVIDAERWAFLSLYDNCSAIVGTRKVSLARYDLIAATSSVHDFLADQPGLLVEIVRL